MHKRVNDHNYYPGEVKDGWEGVGVRKILLGKGGKTIFKVA